MKRHIFAGVVLVLCIAPAHADEWRLGGHVSFMSGVEDISDLYESNFNNTTLLARAETEFMSPIGLAFQGTYNWDSGLRLDLGVGPFFYMTVVSENIDETYDVDYKHYEVPISATVGFTFMPSKATSPYVRAGLIYHLANGTYVEGSNAGLLGAAGLEFNRDGRAVFSIEVAVDQSEVELQRFQAPPPARGDVVALNTYDVIASFIVRF